MHLKRRHKILIGIVLVLISVLFISMICLQKESEFVRRNRLQEMCILGLNRIGVALLEYSVKEGRGLYFPPDLATLVKCNYLKTDDIFYCGTQAQIPYYYLKGAQRDMPGNLPLIVEQGSPHIAISRGKIKKRGLCLFADFSLAYIGENYASILIKDAEAALHLKDVTNKQDLVKILQNPMTADVVKAMALWRLQKMPYPILVAQKYLDSRNFWLAWQAAIVVWQWDKSKARSVLESALLAKNYFIRQRAWQLLYAKNSNINQLEFISSKLSARRITKSR